MDSLGYYGKLPRFGDFLSKRLPEAFVEPWDAWLSRCLVDSQRMLGDAWLDVYLSSPIWRFALSAGVCGEAAWVGIVLPSVDAVERCYPFALVGELAKDASVLDRAVSTEGWYDELEQVALAALDEEPLDDTALEERLSVLAASLQADVPRPLVVHGAPEDVFVAEVPPGMSWPDAMRKSLEMSGARVNRRLCAWWTVGSPDVAPSVLFTAGLPSPRCFTAMMTGEWSRQPGEASGTRLVKACPAPTLTPSSASAPAEQDGTDALGLAEATVTAAPKEALAKQNPG
jgi:type VI secretion system protein ImpM